MDPHRKEVMYYDATDQMQEQNAVVTVGRLVQSTERQQQSIPTHTLIRNFRPVGHLRNLFRCASPDDVAKQLSFDKIQGKEFNDESKWPIPEWNILYNLTLMVDLRMEGEIDLECQSILLAEAPGGAFENVQRLEDFHVSNARRQHFRITCPDRKLSRADLTRHAGKHWFPREIWDKSDPAQQNQLMLRALDARGLAGLFEIILETKPFIATVLQSITLHLEKNPHGKVAFHCSLGKDRTGVIGMLCGSLAGFTDLEIVRDFEQSEDMHAIAFAKFEDFFDGHVDSNRFAESKPETILQTMKYLRDTYGTISNYLEETGFDQTWQSRFRQVVR